MRAVAAGIVAGAIVASAVLAPHGLVRTSSAQPSPPDLTRAKDLYRSAETAMTAQRYSDAARDYGAAYDITKDPVLFYKIGAANERGGRCDVALIYYRRYLREAKPNEAFTTLTKERITVCGGDPKDEGSAAEPAGSGSAVGSARPPGVGSGSGSAVVIEPAEGSAAGSAGGSAAGSAAAAPLKGTHRIAWILIGGSIASFTVGLVMAYSSNAAESDVEDLYVGLAGTPPAFDARTQARFDDLIDEGKRYQTLSWIGFGLAGALAIGAAIKFATDKPAESKQSVHVTPTVTPRGAGLSATVRF